MTGRRLLAKANAVWKSMWFSCIKKAITHEALRETPAWQWTKTAPFDIPSFMNAIAAGK